VRRATTEDLRRTAMEAREQAEEARDEGRDKVAETRDRRADDIEALLSELEALGHDDAELVLDEELPDFLRELALRSGDVRASLAEFVDWHACARRCAPAFETIEFLGRTYHFMARASRSEGETIYTVG